MNGGDLRDERNIDNAAPESDSDTEGSCNNHKRVYCTKCEASLYNPIYQIFEHPLLPVPLCIICFDELNKSSPIGFIDDESDLTELCSWCGGDGVLNLCDNSTCGRAICSKCIRDHLGDDEHERVEDAASWTCYCCTPGSLITLTRMMNTAIECSFFNEMKVQEQYNTAVKERKADEISAASNACGFEEQKGIDQGTASDMNQAGTDNILDEDRIEQEAKVQVLVSLTGKMVQWCAECSERLHPERVKEVENDIYVERHATLGNRFGSVSQQVVEEVELYKTMWQRSWDIVDEQRADLETRLSYLGVQLSAEWHAKELNAPMKIEDESRFEQLRRGEAEVIIEKREGVRAAQKQAAQAAFSRGDAAVPGCDIVYNEDIVEIDDDGLLPQLEEEASRDEIIQQYSDDESFPPLSHATYPPSFEVILPKSVIKAFFYADDREKSALQIKYRIPMHVAIILAYASETVFPESVLHYSFSKRVHPSVLKAIFYCKPLERAALCRRYDLPGDICETTDFGSVEEVLELASRHREQHDECMSKGIADYTTSLMQQQFTSNARLEEAKKAIGTTSYGADDIKIIQTRRKISNRLSMKNNIFSEEEETQKVINNFKNVVAKSPPVAGDTVVRDGGDGQEDNKKDSFMYSSRGILLDVDEIVSYLKKREREKVELEDEDEILNETRKEIRVNKSRTGRNLQTKNKQSLVLGKIPKSTKHIDVHDKRQKMKSNEGQLNKDEHWRSPNDLEFSSEDESDSDDNDQSLLKVDKIDGTQGEDDDVICLIDEEDPARNKIEDEVQAKISILKREEGKDFTSDGLSSTNAGDCNGMIKVTASSGKGQKSRQSEVRGGDHCDVIDLFNDDDFIPSTRRGDNSNKIVDLTMSSDEENLKTPSKSTLNDVSKSKTSTASNITSIVDSSHDTNAINKPSNEPSSGSSGYSWTFEQQHPSNDKGSRVDSWKLWRHSSGDNKGVKSGTATSQIDGNKLQKQFVPKTGARPRSLLPNPGKAQHKYLVKYAQPTVKEAFRNKNGKVSKSVVAKRSFGKSAIFVNSSSGSNETSSSLESSNADSDDDTSASGGKEIWGRRRRNSKKKLRRIDEKMMELEASKEALEARSVERKRKLERLSFRHFNADDGFALNPNRPEEDEPVILIKKFDKCLKNHQKEALIFLWDNVFRSVKDAKIEIPQLPETNGCIVAHCMGLGKTLTIIAFTATLFTNPVINGIIDPYQPPVNPNAGQELTSSKLPTCVAVEEDVVTSSAAAAASSTAIAEQPKEVVKKKKLVHSALIVAPKNTLQNWYEEYDYWMPDELKPFVNVNAMHRKMASCGSRKGNMVNRVRKLKNWSENGGVMIIGYEMMIQLTDLDRANQDQMKKKRGRASKEVVTGFDTSVRSEVNLLNQEAVVMMQPSAPNLKPDIDSELRDLILEARKYLLDPGPDLIVADEAHLIKEPKTKRSRTLSQVRTRRRIALTGSPLQNNMMEYWCMFSWVKEMFLDNRQKFMKLYHYPIRQGGLKEATASQRRQMHFRSKKIHKMLSPYIHRRDLGELAKFLPPKREFVLSIKLSPFQTYLYKLYMTKLAVKMKDTKKLLFQAFQVILRLANHPSCLVTHHLMARHKEEVAESSEPGRTKKPVYSLTRICQELRGPSFHYENCLANDHEELDRNAISIEKRLLGNVEGSSDRTSRGVKKSKERKKKAVAEDGSYDDDDDDDDDDDEEDEGDGDEDEDDSLADFIVADDVIEYEDKEKTDDSAILEKPRKKRRLSRATASDNGDSSIEMDCSESNENELSNEGEKEADSLEGNATKLVSSSDVPQSIACNEQQLQLTDKVDDDDDDDKIPNIGREESESTDDQPAGETVVETDWWKVGSHEGDGADGKELSISDMLAMSNKLITFLRLLALTVIRGEKMILFSQSLDTLDLIEKVLHLEWGNLIASDADHDIKEKSKLLMKWMKDTHLLRIDGSVNQRQTLIKRFNDEKAIKLFLVSTRAGNMGINLQAANRVVIFDSSWNPANDLQAIYRAYRFGQKKSVFVYRLITGGMEEAIYCAQVNKLSLAARVVDAQLPDNHFTEKQMTNILELSENSDDDEGGVSSSSAVSAAMEVLNTGTRDEVLLEYVERHGAEMLSRIWDQEVLLADNEDNHNIPEEEERIEEEIFQRERAGEVISSKDIDGHIQPPNISAETDNKNPKSLNSVTVASNSPTETLLSTIHSTFLGPIQTAIGSLFGSSGSQERTTDDSAESSAQEMNGIEGEDVRNESSSATSNNDTNHDSIAMQVIEDDEDDAPPWTAKEDAILIATVATHRENSRFFNLLLKYYLGPNATRRSAAAIRDRYQFLVQVGSVDMYRKKHAKQLDDIFRIIQKQYNQFLLGNVR